MLATIKSANSVAFKDSDQLAIHAAIRKGSRQIRGCGAAVGGLSGENRRMLGEDDPRTFNISSNLAGLYIDLGKYWKAEPLYLNCLERSRRVHGEDHPDTLSSIDNLAEWYYSQGKHKEAEPLYVDCLERRRRVLGEDHPNTLSSINNLAVLYENQGKYDEAEPLYVDCLERRRRVLGEDHPTTQTSRDCLALLQAEIKSEFNGSGRTEIANGGRTFG
ncbi:hypothetical protein HK104_003646 [Borealophlyctis nickersoniae]|nr:hypothetical protein HK104_003646 [Borealophlyctis nickersoniae]